MARFKFPSATWPYPIGNRDMPYREYSRYQGTWVGIHMVLEAIQKVAFHKLTGDLFYIGKPVRFETNPIWERFTALPREKAVMAVFRAITVEQGYLDFWLQSQSVKRAALSRKRPRSVEEPDEQDLVQLVMGREHVLALRADRRWLAVTKQGITPVNAAYAAKLAAFVRAHRSFDAVNDEVEWRLWNEACLEREDDEEEGAHDSDSAASCFTAAAT